MIKLKRYEEALPPLQSAARLDTKNAVLREKIGDVLCELERYEEAVDAYEQAIRLDRGFVLAYRSKAAALEKQGQQQETLAAYEEALAAYDKAVNSRPDNFFVHFFRADVLTHLGRYDEATETYDRAERLAPHPLLAVHCIFGQASVETRAEAQARLLTAGKEVSEKAIAAEIELMHKEKKLEPLRSSLLFWPICQWMQERQEWIGTPKQFKEVLCQRFPDAFTTWYRSPRKYVEELEKIAPALHEEGIEVSVPSHTTLVTLTRATTAVHPSEDHSSC